MWQFYAILAVSIFAVVNIIDKYIIDKVVKKPMSVLVIAGIVSLAVSVLIFIFHDVNVSFKLALLLLLSGVMYFFFGVLYFKAVKIEDISKISSLIFITPVFISMMGYLFLHESLSFIKYTGILLLVTGAYTLTRKQGMRFSPSLILMVFASLFLSFDAVITKYALGFTDVLSILAVERLGFFLASLFLYRTHFMHAIKRSKIIFVNETIAALGSFTTIVAFTYGYVTLVSAISAVQPLIVLLFAFILSRFYPKFMTEKIDKKKVIPIFLIIAGALLITVF